MCGWELKSFRLPEPDFNQRNSDAVEISLLPDVRQEHTLVGVAIGAVRDYWDGRKHTAQERTERAKANDEMAVIAADTVAFLPVLKANVGGLIRGGLLWDPNLGLTDNLPGFGKNVLEGYGLSKVCSLALPQSGFMSSTTAVLGNGFKSATAAHFAVGLGMGAVKTGFNPDAWVDAQGQLSLKTVGGNLLSSSLLAGVVNVPAGTIGSFIGKAGTLALGKGFTSQLATGVGAGWAGGCVFGGVDSVLSGRAKDADSLWSDIWHGGKIGGVTGGLTHGLQHLATSRVWSAGCQPAQAKAVLGNSTRLTSVEFDVVTAKRSNTLGHDVLEQGHEAGSQRRDAETRYRRVRDTLDDHPSLFELNDRLRGGHNERRNFLEVVDFNTTWETPEEYVENALENHWRNVRVYEVDGHTAKIVVPEDVAKVHDELRELRLVAAKMADIDRYPTLEQREIHEAIRVLSLHPNRYAALPEDCVAILDQLVNRTYCRELVLEFRQNPYDEATRLKIVQEIKAMEAEGRAVPAKLEKLSRDYRAAAVASDDGVITLHNLETGTDLRDIMFHEDAHLMYTEVTKENPGLDDAWMIAARMENKGYFADYYAHRNPDENFAVHVGEVMEHQDFDRMIHFAKEAPLRAAVACKFLQQAHNSVPDGIQGKLHDDYGRRIDYLQQKVLPRAQDILVESIRSGSEYEKVEAVKLLGHLGTERHLTRLKSLAASAKDWELSKRACDAAVSVAESLNTDFDVLVELAAPTSKCRSWALDYLESHTDARATQYLKLLQYAGCAGNARAVADIIEQMPDRAGRELAFCEALQLGRESANVRDLMYLFDKAESVSQRQKVFEAAMNSLSDRPALFIDTMQSMMRGEPKLKPPVSVIIDLQQFARGKASINREARELLDGLRLWPGLPEDSTQQLAK